MGEFTDYYSILGINQNATANEISIAYKKQCLKWHPDRNMAIDANRRMQNINEAKRILSDTELRKNYNAKYQAFKTRSANQTKRKAENKKSENASTPGNYVCNFKSDDELIRTCANAAKYNFEYIHAVLQELKRRNYSLDNINGIIKQKANPSK